MIPPLKLGCQADSIIRFVYQSVILFQVGSVVQLFSSVLCHLFFAAFTHEETLCSVSVKRCLVGFGEKSCSLQDSFLFDCDEGYLELMSGHSVFMESVSKNHSLDLIYGFN